MSDPFRDYDAWRLSTPDDDDATDPDAPLCTDCEEEPATRGKLCAACNQDRRDCAAEDARDGEKDEAELARLAADAEAL